MLGYVVENFGKFIKNGIVLKMATLFFLNPHNTTRYQESTNFESQLSDIYTVVDDYFEKNKIFHPKDTFPNTPSKHASSKGMP